MAGNSYSNSAAPGRQDPPVPPSAAPASAPVPAYARNEAIYGQDPRMAMMAVLKNMGYNMFQSNPFISMLMNAAPGLHNLWELSNIGAQAPDIAANGGAGQMFGDFLRNEIGQGSVFNSLASGLRNFSGYTDQLRGLQTQLQNDPTMVGRVPVFLDQLESNLSSPGGFSQIYGSLAQPLLGRGLGQSFQNTLGAAASNAWPSYVDNPRWGQPGPPFNFFDYVMGR
jgi:hypothetical protein